MKNNLLWKLLLSSKKVKKIYDKNNKLENHAIDNTLWLNSQ